MSVEFEISLFILGVIVGMAFADRIRDKLDKLDSISAEEDLFPELSAEEKAENKAEAKRMIGGADG